MDSFSGFKTNPSPIKTDTNFYDLLVARLEAAADRKIKQEYDPILKKMTLYFEGIPTSVLGLTQENTVIGFSMLPVFKDFIASIAKSGIVDSDLIAKAQMKEDQPAALDILFRVILPIFVRIDVFLRNSDSPVSDDEFVTKIREISDEEWTVSSCEKVNNSLDDLENLKSLIKSSPMQNETHFSPGKMPQLTADNSPVVPKFGPEEEFLYIPEGSIADADRKRKCIFIEARHDSPQPLTPQKKDIPMKFEEIKKESHISIPMSSEHSSIDVITLDDEDSLTQCSSPNSSAPEQLVLPPTTINSQDVDSKVKKESRPEIEIIGENLAGSPCDRPSKTSRRRIRNKQRRAKQIAQKLLSKKIASPIKPTMAPAPQKQPSNIPSLLSISTAPETSSSFSSNGQSRPGDMRPLVWSNQCPGMQRSSPPVKPSSSQAAGIIVVGPPVNFTQVLSPRPACPPPSRVLLNPPPPTAHSRLKEIETMMTVLRKIAWELESELLENSEALPDSISFTSSIGNPETTIFVGYSVRKNHSPECYSEGRYWSLVQLYQSLHHVFPLFVLDDIRASAVSGLWVKVDHILFNTKQLLVFAAVKLKELARLNQFAKSGDLQLVVQQRLVITEAIQNSSRSFWGPPPPVPGLRRFP